MTSGDNFKAACQRRKLTTYQVAAMLGVSQPVAARAWVGASLEWYRNAADKLGWPRQELSPDLSPRKKGKQDV